MHTPRRLICICGTFALTAALAMPAQAQTATDSAASRAVSQIKASIFNFGKISDSYFRGGELKATGVADLVNHGVKTVIDLRSDQDFDPAESTMVTGAGMKYVRIPMTTRVAPTLEQITSFLKLVTDPAAQPVYVHCVEGRHRTGVMTAVYRMNVSGWDAATAFSEMKKFKFGMDFLHPEFKKFVYGYRPAPATVAAPAAVTASVSGAEAPAEVRPDATPAVVPAVAPLLAAPAN